MYLFKKVSDLQHHLHQLRAGGRKIGFAPTMGALHQGHLSLIRRAAAENDCTVCSIFVNPTQFNDAADLEKYPRTAANDIHLLTSKGNNVLFMPPVEEVYPPDLDTKISFSFGPLAAVMEGAHRPGHFEGMAQVVKRLLDIVQPDGLYMGQKDFQQLAIVRSMLKQLGSGIDLVMCPIIREEDGLAMSSRNVRLDPALRPQAALLSQTLQKTKALQDQQSPAEISAAALNTLTRPGFRPEYFEIVDGRSLQRLHRFEETDFAVACTAVWVGEVRLIDNLILKGPG
ncbi:MAG: pantoate--beta-alanine ligase [Bacteroidota bacterium]